ERGEVLDGYSRVLQAMDALGIKVTGEAALDARALGLALARKAARVEALPARAVDRECAEAWDQLRRRVARKSWAHRLHVLHFKDLLGDRRWIPDRIIPRVRKVSPQGVRSGSSLSEVRLSDLGLVRLLDAMGPKRPKDPLKTEELLANV